MFNISYDTPHGHCITVNDVHHAFRSTSPIYQQIYEPTISQIYSIIICKLYILINIEQLRKTNDRLIPKLYITIASGKISQKQFINYMRKVSKRRIILKQYIDILNEVSHTIEWFINDLLNHIRSQNLIDLSQLDQYMYTINQSISQINRHNNVPKRAKLPLIQLYDHW